LTLTGVANATRRPQLERVAAPSPHLDRAVEVGSGIARRFSTGARRPVLAVHLPQSNIKAAAGVLVGRICIASAFVGHDALALGLIPATVLRTPLLDILSVGAGAAGAAAAVIAWAVAAARVSRSEIAVAIRNSFQLLSLRNGNLDVHDNAAQRRSGLVRDSQLDFGRRSYGSKTGNLVIEHSLPRGVCRKGTFKPNLAAQIQLQGINHFASDRNDTGGGSAS